MNIYRIPLLVISLLAFWNCSAPEPNKVDSTQPASVPDECTAETADDETVDGEVTTDGETDAEADTEDADASDTDAGANLLQDEITWEKDIKPLVEQGCAISGCHVAGAQSPTLETYSQNVSAANSSLAEIQAGDMPVGTAYSDAQKALWQAWVDGGTVQGEPVAASDGEEEGASDGDGTAASTEDGGDGETTDDDGGAEESVECEVADTTTTGIASELMNEEDVKACNDKGVLYDRNEKACSSISTDITYTCDRDGIEKAFANSGLDARAILNQSLGKSATDKGEGFSIDQCGQTAGGLPVVILVRVQEPPEIPGLKVRVLTVD